VEWEEASQEGWEKKRERKGEGGDGGGYIIRLMD
jgi:hypothetical protein